MEETPIAYAIPAFFRLCDWANRPNLIIIDNEYHYLKITLEALPEYAQDADRIFLMVGEDEVSRSVYENYLKNDVWNGIPAVKNGNVYLLEGSKGWGTYDPLGLEFELAESVSVLRQAP